MDFKSNRETLNVVDLHHPLVDLSWNAPTPKLLATDNEGDVISLSNLFNIIDIGEASAGRHSRVQFSHTKQSIINPNNSQRTTFIPGSLENTFDVSNLYFADSKFLRANHTKINMTGMQFTEVRINKYEHQRHESLEHEWNFEGTTFKPLKTFNNNGHMMKIDLQPIPVDGDSLTQKDYLLTNRKKCTTPTMVSNNNADPKKPQELQWITKEWNILTQPLLPQQKGKETKQLMTMMKYHPKSHLKNEHIFWRHLYNNLIWLEFKIKLPKEYSETWIPRPTVKTEHLWTKLHKTKMRNKILACNWKVHTNASINSKIWPKESPERLCNRGCGEQYDTKHRYFLCIKLREVWTQKWFQEEYDFLLNPNSNTQRAYTRKDLRPYLQEIKVCNFKE
ncbi:hypothetical protein CONCODRAFT_7381 [Conidiobolus coronatus NRRL 28638]|uniref:Uncharacterized protein n=1 Tax=Conidiobolus coronatus (strain ATCC 28846 / CBS 209.66 / NRRL 28638) TaxID=796925 RepID=A0A137P5B0_CONC2|nr:hypothetical protein CONCODRAFT_7381 [Conidiobolus coronatus NRRL 28638]|eukprot:KXN70139.1 hypothetical protein CONCODRAFT_7381 [Conidiobolus coronatus NRRL 28638]